MPTFKYFLLIAICFLIFIPSVSAFGAGEIPDFAYLNDKAFRHLDIENILEFITRWVGERPPGGGGGGTGGLLGAAASFLKSGGGELKFTKADVHRIYFGNWLRDYSQAMDIAGLSKATSETIILLLSVLSFMTFGYATEEFELLGDKLGVYLPVEHIVNNPKGYGADEDPRKYHKKLRGPVDRRELEIDPRTGMKNYIANDGQGWDTSAAHVRRSLEKLIPLARKSGGHRCPELYEAYRLMGGALHTLEDLLAHSNWIELSLRKMGHNEVFCHVGDSATVKAPGGQRVPPLVTGTFGSADFIFSVMGEAGDKLSESSVSELSKKVANAQGKEETLSTIKSLLSSLPSSGGDDDMQKGEELRQKAVHFDPDNYVTEDVQTQLLDLLRWRDTIMRRVDSAIEHIPGLENTVGQLTDALNVYIYTTIEPYVKPVLGQASDAICAGSRTVIDQDDQYECFNNPEAHDPSHSMLSKDHFDNILNEPAGKIAKVVVEVAVNKIVACWSDPNGDIRRTTDEILMAFHHPWFADDRCQMHVAMSQAVQKWFNGLGGDQKETLRRLTKESVRDGKNKRLGADENTPMHSHMVGSHQSGGRTGGHGASTGGYGASGGGYGQQQQQGRQQQQQQQSGTGYGGSTTGYGAQQQHGRSDNDYSRNTTTTTTASYGTHRQDDSYGSGGRHQDDSSGYGSRRQDDDSRTQTSGYGSGTKTSHDRHEGGQSYGQSTGGYGSEERSSHTQPSTYGSQTQGRSGYGQSSGYGDKEQPSYGQSTGGYGSEERSSYNQSSAYGSETQGRSGYGDKEQSSYGQSTGGGYGSQVRTTHGESGGYGGQQTTGYGRSQPAAEVPGQLHYGSTRTHDDDDHGSGRHQQHGSSRRDDDDYGSSHRGQESSYGQQSRTSGGHRQGRGDDDEGSRGSYGRSGGGGSDTYGVERLNISERQGGHSGHGGGTTGGYGSKARDSDDDDDDKDRYKKSHKKKHHKDDDDSN